MGLSIVAGAALDHGRYSVAWGCVGISQACLEHSVQHSSERSQFSKKIKDHQLIQKMITDMITQIRAARLICLYAGYLKGINDPNHVRETLIAKYFASKVVNRIASNAVQIHGATGCVEDSPVSRYLRDAKIMEIIEGSSQIQQIMIAKYGYTDFNTGLDFNAGRL
jgi:alkylation response protein AidB-like acyl-CoA dehydrogenase